MINCDTDTNLSTYTTFGVKAAALAVKKVSDTHILEEAIDVCRKQNEPFLILGSGSNMLFAEDFEGTVFINELSGISVVEEQANDVIVNVASGENWHNFVQYCLTKNWLGLENLALIPGTVGAAPIQNIGAYGTEVSEYITKVFVLDLDNKERFWLHKNNCEFGYRDSIFKKNKDRYFVECVQFSLITNKDYSPKFEYETLKKRLNEKNISNPTAQDVFEAVVEVRQNRLPDPKTLGNAGSFFKNPVVSKTKFLAIQDNYPEMPFYEVGEQVKIPAGWLIEKAGLKGLKKGSVGTFEKQALVLVNHGGATASEVWNFAMFVNQKVESLFGIELVPEVNVVKGSKIMEFH